MADCNVNTTETDSNTNTSTDTKDNEVLKLLFDDKITVELSMSECTNIVHGLQLLAQHLPNIYNTILQNSEFSDEHKKRAFAFAKHSEVSAKVLIEKLRQLCATNITKIKKIYEDQYKSEVANLGLNKAMNIIIGIS